MISIHALLRLIAGKSASFSIRRPRSRKLSLEQFEDRRVLTAAADDYYSISPGRTLVDNSPLGIMSNDAINGDEDTEGTITREPSHGTLNEYQGHDEEEFATIGMDFTYQPDDEFTGTDSFDYAIYAQGDGYIWHYATVYIAVEGDPFDGDSEYTTDEDVPLDINVQDGLLADANTNSSEAPLSVTGYSKPGNGSVTVNSDGSFSYTPNSLFHGSDAFTYTASDGFHSLPTFTVSITVDAVNHAPSAGSNSYVLDVSQNSSLVVGGNASLLNNDSDIDGDTIYVSAHTAASHGSLTFNSSDGTFTYTPNSGFYATDTFDYTISDGALESTTSVTIRVDRPPTANNSSRSGFDVYTDGTTGNVLTESSASDPDGDSLTAVLVSDVSTEAGHVTLQSDGSYVYSSPNGFLGDTEFSFAVTDGYLTSATHTVSLHVLPHAYDDVYTLDTSISNTLTVPAGSGVLYNDKGATSATYFLASHGTITPGSNGAFVYTRTDLTFTGDEVFVYGAGGPETDNPSVVQYNYAYITIHII